MIPNSARENCLPTLLVIAFLAACGQDVAAQRSPATPPAPAPVPVPAAATSAATVARPPYNTGDGFFVLKGRLYDSNGKEFRIRGVNRTHYDFWAQPAISNSGANTVRYMMYTASVGANTYVEAVRKEHIAFKQVPIITMSNFLDDTYTACSEDVAKFRAGVGWWVANAPAFTRLNKYMIVNIANEWGPTNNPVWRDEYIAAVAAMRKAGYLGALLIDAGGCGQDMWSLEKYSGAVFNSDPQKNVLFAFHAYGKTTPTNIDYLFGQMSTFAAATGAAYIIGEFGPGRDIGPSPTILTPAQVITTAEANGLGWLAWAWDDNNLVNGRSDDKWFSMTYHAGTYSSPADLTIFGKDVVLNPVYGIKALAKPATIF